MGHLEVAKSVLTRRWEGDAGDGRETPEMPEVAGCADLEMEAMVLCFRAKSRV